MACWHGWRRPAPPAERPTTQAPPSHAVRCWKMRNRPYRGSLARMTRKMIPRTTRTVARSEEHTSELQSQSNLVCRLLLEKKKKKNKNETTDKINKRVHNISQLS